MVDGIGRLLRTRPLGWPDAENLSRLWRTGRADRLRPPDLRTGGSRRRGDVALGGCVIGDDDPNRRCPCGNDWNTHNVRA